MDSWNTGIFRHGREFWGEPTDQLTLYAARSPRAEAEEIGCEILKKVRDQGFRFRDLAVVTGNLEVYGPLMEQTFARLGIPAFIDRKRDVLKNPFVEFVRALLAAVQEDFSLRVHVPAAAKRNDRCHYGRDRPAGKIMCWPEVSGEFPGGRKSGAILSKGWKRKNFPS